VLVLLAGLALAEPPPVIAGDYTVAQIRPQMADEMQDFSVYMHHQAMATGDKCYTVERVFGFGDVPEGEGPHRPSTVSVHETITCTRGGLGTYHTTATLELPATWEGDGNTVLKLPAGTAVARITRLRRPRDVAAPAMWVGDEVRFELPASEMQFDAPSVRKGQLPELHMLWKNDVYTLSPREQGRR
jgi:hypothetical protein